MSGAETDGDEADAATGGAARASATRVPAGLAALGFGLAALLGVASAWGFSVDDALISTRVAHHLASGAGYRFNLGGARVDCVTPLGWAWLLAPFAGAGPWQALTFASIGGAGAWVLGAAWLGRRCAALCSRGRFALLALLLASCLPLAAWAVSGMETAFVLVLGTAALAGGRRGAAAAGVAAAWRPELLPWALSLALGGAIARRAPLPERALAVALAVLPALLVAGIRAAVFGHPAPLAVFAKPSDLEHGLRYGFGALCLAGPCYLLAAGRGYARLPRELRAIPIAVAVHLLALVGVGGDWMPFWRLAAPVFPGVFLVGAALLEPARWGAVAARSAAVLACSALLHGAQGSATRAVRAERAALIRDARPLLQGALRIATLDAGWVGSASEADIVDLAGVTDPEVAYLPGGHTSKRLPADFLLRRRADALVVLAQGEWAQRSYARAVEGRLMGLRGAEGFVAVGELPLNAHQAYVVLRRQVPAPE